MALFGLHAPIFGPLHPIIGKLNGSTGLTGFTDTYVPFGNTAGGLDEHANFTWNGTTLGVTGNITASNEITGLELVADHNIRITGNYALKWRDSGDTTTRAYISYDGVLRLINSSGSISLDPTTVVDVSGNLDVTGTGNVDGATTLGSTLNVTGISHMDDKVEYTDTTEYIDQEIW